MTSQFFKAWGARYARAGLLGIGLSILGFAALAAIMIFSAMVPVSRESDRQFVFLGLFVCFIVSSLAITLAATFAVVIRRGRTLDEAFVPLGLRGGGYFLNGRQYHGTALGRQVDAYFYRGPTMDLYVAANTQTRASIGRKDSVGLAIGAMLKRQPVEMNDPELRELSVFAADEHWARSLLADPEARHIVLGLISDATGPGIQQLHVQPDSVYLRLLHTRTSVITAENVRRWAGDLCSLARIAETLPPPAERAEASKMERNSRINRDAFTLPAFALTCGVLGVMVVCVVAIVVPLIWLDTR